MAMKFEDGSATKEAFSGPGSSFESSGQAAPGGAYDGPPVPVRRALAEGLPVRLVEWAAAPSVALRVYLTLRGLPHEVVSLAYPRTEPSAELPRLEDGHYWLAGEAAAMDHLEHFYPEAAGALVGVAAADDEAGAAATAEEAEWAESDAAAEASVLALLGRLDVLLVALSAADATYVWTRWAVAWRSTRWPLGAWAATREAVVRQLAAHKTRWGAAWSPGFGLGSSGGGDGTRGGGGGSGGGGTDDALATEAAEAYKALDACVAGLAVGGRSLRRQRVGASIAGHVDRALQVQGAAQLLAAHGSGLLGLFATTASRLEELGGCGGLLTPSSAATARELLAAPSDAPKQAARHASGTTGGMGRAALGLAGLAGLAAVLHRRGRLPLLLW